MMKTVKTQIVSPQLSVVDEMEEEILYECAEEENKSNGGAKI